MRDTCKTVRIVAPVSTDNPHGHITINASDLTDAHVLFDAEPARVEKDATPKKPRTRKTEQPELPC